MGDRIELVIVAPGTGYGRGEEGARRRIDLLIGDIKTELPDISLVEPLTPTARNPVAIVLSPGELPSSFSIKSPASCSVIISSNGLSAL